ncbi:MAG: ribosome maturation factor RimM [Bacteroidota bacterium]
MKKADCFQLGHVAKLHGYKGEVSLFFDTSHPEDYANLDAIFIELNGHLTPFFIEEIDLRSNRFARVCLEGVRGEKEARQLLQKEIYLPMAVLPKLEGPHFYDHEVIGFAVLDEVKGMIGTLKEVVDYENNPLLRVICIENGEEKEILLPLNTGLVKQVDRAGQTLSVDAPEGLIDMYLNA